LNWLRQGKMPSSTARLSKSDVFLRYHHFKCTELFWRLSPHCLQRFFREGSLLFSRISPSSLFGKMIWIQRASDLCLAAYFCANWTVFCSASPTAFGVQLKARFH
jgi:hypothetical protein